MSTAPSRVEQGDWRQLGEQASEIRRQVFIEEQAVPQEEEWDGRDDECLHFLARLDGQPVGTARLLPDGHIGRVAVLAAGRGRGIGLALMQAAIEAARERGHAHAELAAQTHALAFYRRLGFEAYGPEFLDAGIAHRNMRLDLA
ncbi:MULTISPECIES: GNAT family N-acetyltransferase [Halomonadaceae]|uniref:GNAT family N-acetyltransferase n=1 Tax=Modicisalibacter zincidurans TaxID=1178777 RepID=A0ABP9QZW1_9GAMM|nr:MULTISPECIES: GNAT family N-acetyltransferase [Halomonas]MCD6009301.1 GNAT family N-acetyltransferase [Halomonas sp. IOP_31]